MVWTVLPHNGIESVTIDERGTIYLIGEQIQDGSNLLPNPASQLIVLTAPVPERESHALMLEGLGLLGWKARRRLPGPDGPALGSYRRSRCAEPMQYGQEVRPF